MRTDAYFPENGSEEKVANWLSQLDRKRKWKGEITGPALLILDMQKFFTDPTSHAFIPASTSIKTIISNIVEVFHGPIILTRHLQPEDDTNLMNIWWRDRIQGEFSKIDIEITGIDIEMITKEHYSAFFRTDLAKKLRKQGVTSVIITGLMTDLCCETTARDAFMNGFKVFFIADGTATATEERHLSSLKAISTGFGEVITSKELMSRL